MPSLLQFLRRCRWGRCRAQQRRACSCPSLETTSISCHHSAKRQMCFMQVRRPRITEGSSKHNIHFCIFLGWNQPTFRRSYRVTDCVSHGENAAGTGLLAKMSRGSRVCQPRLLQTYQRKTLPGLKKSVKSTTFFRDENACKTPFRQLCESDFNSCKALKTVSAAT